MQDQQYCVYNQTNECFLSLGATPGASRVARLKRALGIGSRVDEGCWITPPRGMQTLSVSSSRDLVYLDAEYRVVDIVEAFPPFRTAPIRKNAASLLALPLHTIRSSQTRPGNRILICAPEEMEWRLRHGLEKRPADSRLKSRQRSDSGPDWIPGYETKERPMPQRGNSSFPARRFPADEEFAGNVIRNLSAKGLYLVTAERWPLGAEVKMSFQLTDDVITTPIAVQLRVMRWGADGVALEFIQPGVEHSELMHMHVC